MVIVEINSGNHGSVGNIMLGIAKTACRQGHSVYTFCPPGHMQKQHIPGNSFIGTIWERRICDIVNYYTGYQGSLNYIGTYRLIKKLEIIKPDIIQLHNLHSNFINLKMLFRYLTQTTARVVWTLHDCWAFTGNCPHFTVLGCDKWKTGCTKCDYAGYPKGKRDIGNILYQYKKELFTSVKNMTIVVPSNWLADLVRKSYLGNFAIKVIYNGIDLSKFKPTFSDFRIQNGIENKFVILAVAFTWNYHKGLDRIRKIACNLNKDYQLIIVGASIGELEVENTICIPRTDSQKALAEIYSIADVFLNVTREDTFPTVNLEALACGTPVLSYGACGSAEAFDKKTGMIIRDDSVIDVLEQMRHGKIIFKKEDCVNRAHLFDLKVKFGEYLSLYEESIQIEKEKDL